MTKQAQKVRSRRGDPASLSPEEQPKKNNTTAPGQVREIDTIGKRQRKNKTGVSVPNFQIWYDRHGKPRCCHRPTGTTVDCRRFPLGSDEFYEECKRIDAGFKSVPKRCESTFRMQHARRAVEYLEQLLTTLVASLAKRGSARLTLQPGEDNPDRQYLRSRPLLQYAPEDFWMGN